jgi:hypothetical protein
MISTAGYVWMDPKGLNISVLAPSGSNSSKWPNLKKHSASDILVLCVMLLFVKLEMCLVTA